MSRSSSSFKQFAAVFPSGSPRDKLTGDVLDLSRNFLGDRGVVPIIAVIERSPTIKSIVLVENGLRNNAIKSLCNSLAHHTGVTSVDVSHNFISEGAGNAILALLKENRKIVQFDIQNTKIDAELRVAIKDALEQNVVLATVGGEGK
jgi:Ran GTPase-activating protein (RanGAP) involved in mRNA processing and transport